MKQVTRHSLLVYVSVLLLGLCLSIWPLLTEPGPERFAAAVHAYIPLHILYSAYLHNIDMARCVGYTCPANVCEAAIVTIHSDTAATRFPPWISLLKTLRIPRPNALFKLNSGSGP